MYRIIDERGTGKTKKLLLEAQKNNGIVACSNPIAMERKAIDYGILGISMISYNDLLKYQYEEPIYIDELEMFIKYANINMQGYTLSKEN